MPETQVPTAARARGAKLRRAPRQTRAKQTVEAILIAAKRLVSRHGLEGTTTNQVARAAGVSIGSLYQYFPAKAALVAELRRRHQQLGLELLAQGATALAAAPVAVVVRRFVAQMIEVHRAELALHRTLEQHGQDTRSREAELRALAIMRSYLEQHRRELVVQDVDQAAFVVGVVLEAVTHRSIVERPDLLESDTFVDGVARMLTAYLIGGVPATPEAQDAAAQPTEAATTRLER